MNKNISVILIIITGLMTACQKQENIKSAVVKPEKPLRGYFGNNVTNRVKTVRLYKDTVYVLSEFFVREAGEQLVIDEGTLIKVNTGGSQVGITIQPGGIIIANGNAANPIVFTSDEQQGNQQANWGGIIIQGNSVNNSSNPAGDPTDQSGTLNYVRIEFAGLVLNSVGSRTTVENVQVSYCSGQPSFEINGGTFNARNLVSFACGGPADFYFTRGYTGKMQNVLAYRHPYFGKTGINPPYNTVSGVFIENNDNNSTATPYTHPVISNLTVIGPNGQNGSTPAYSDTSSLKSGALVTTGNAFFSIRNSALFGFPAAGWYLDDALTGQNVQSSDAYLMHSIVQCQDSTRAFYLRTGVVPPYTKEDFRAFELDPRFHNRLYFSVSSFQLPDPFYYDKPGLLPKDNSPLLSGANFDSPEFSSYFNKVTYIGALGKENWLAGWTNFIPLKTNYNFSK
jgi:hypothetical protein